MNTTPLPEPPMDALSAPAHRTIQFSHELRGAITASGLSLRELRAALAQAGHAVSLATLSAWQNGTRVPSSSASCAAVEALETILEVDTGCLRDLVGEVRRRGRRPHYESLHAHMPERSLVEQLLESLDFMDPDDQPHELFVVEQVNLSAASPVVTVDVHILMRTLQSGPCRIPSINVLPSDVPNVKPEITPLNGCRIGLETNWPNERSYGAELILDDDAAAGALLFCGFRITWQIQPQDCREITYTVPRAAREILVQAQFDDELAPVNCRAFRVTASEEKTEPVLVNASNRIQATGQNFGPGLIGLQWEWEGDPTP